MKKSVLFVLGCFICNFIYSQNCKYEKNEIDKFTEKKILITEPVKISDNIEIKKKLIIKKVEIQTSIEASKRKLSLFVYLQLGGVAYFNPDDKLICLMSDKSIVELKVADNLPKSMLKGLWTIDKYDYFIDDFNYNLLIQYNITDIRIVSPLETIDVSFIKGVSSTNLFKCIE